VQHIDDDDDGAVVSFEGCVYNITLVDVLFVCGLWEYNYGMMLGV
jgi:hypothetical protein